MSLIYPLGPAGSVNIGATGYTAQGVRFASTQLVASSLTGMADGQKGIISFWFKFVGNDGNFQVLFEGRLQCFSLFRDTANKWNFTLLAPGGGVALNFVGTTTYSSSMKIGRAHV